MHVNSPNTHEAPSPTGSPLVQVPDPEFEGQTKTRLGNPEVRKIVEGIVGQVRVCSSRVHRLRILTPAQGLESSLFCGSSSLLQHGAAVLRAWRSNGRRTFDAQDAGNGAEVWISGHHSYVFTPPTL